MTLVNYLLVGILGTIVAIALYAARWDMSSEAAPQMAPGIFMAT
jgi:putative flippase GtrA